MSALQGSFFSRKVFATRGSPRDPPACRCDCCSRVPRAAISGWPVSRASSAITRPLMGGHDEQSIGKAVAGPPRSADPVPVRLSTLRPVDEHGPAGCRSAQGMGTQPLRPQPVSACPTASDRTGPTIELGPPRRSPHRAVAQEGDGRGSDPDYWMSRPPGARCGSRRHRPRPSASIPPSPVMLGLARDIRRTGGGPHLAGHAHHSGSDWRHPPRSR